MVSDIKPYALTGRGSSKTGCSDTSTSHYENLALANRYCTTPKYPDVTSNKGPKGVQTSSKSIYILYFLIFVIIILLAVAAYVFVKMDTEMKHIQVLAVESASELQKLSETITLQSTNAPGTTTTIPGLTIKDLNASLDDLIKRLEQENQQRKTQISSIVRKIQDAEDNVDNADKKTSDLENLLNSKTNSLLNSVNALDKATGGWYKASNNLYYKLFTNAVTYSTATTFCRNMGARLAATGFRSSSARSEIINHVVVPAIPASQHVWIGLDDISTEYRWTWQDGISTDSNINWAPGEPNNGEDEDCAETSSEKSWKFNDVSCTTSHYFVCEKN